MENMSGGVVVGSTQTQTQEIIVHNFDNFNINNNNQSVMDNNDVSSMKDNIKKKKNRRSRRSRQNSSSFSTGLSVMDDSNSGGCVGSSRSNYEGSNEGLLNIHKISADMHGNSSPDGIVDENSVGYVSKEFSPYHSNGFHTRRACFAPHLSQEDISSQIEKGNVFRALFRVNAHNRVEAYCKIEGVQTDILINGLVPQNRAVEGDIVAVEVDPPFLWTKMKGLGGATNGSADECSLRLEGVNLVEDSSIGKNKLGAEYDYSKNGFYQGIGCFSGEIHHVGPSGLSDGCYHNGDHLVMSESDLSWPVCSGLKSQVPNAVDSLSAVVHAYPSKRPTGRVVGIIERSVRRDRFVGFLMVKQWIHSRENHKKESKKSKQSSFNREYILLTPTDARFPRMLVTIRSLPDCMKKRLEVSDLTVEMDLVAGRIVDWGEESCLPKAHVAHVLGRGGDTEAHIAAILFENAIDESEFSPEVQSCLPHLPWEIPQEEYERRRDFRKLCVFAIDPATATDLDDALSVEKLSNGNYRVGVHIADVSYFVRPNTALDVDAQMRSTSVYLLQRKLPMLPPLLSENLGSLNPGVDKLSFSMLWDIDPAGKILDRWIGRAVVRSCCKLSYEHARDIVDGVFVPQIAGAQESNGPKLYGDFEWSDITSSVKYLHEISRVLKENRFNDGALSLENPKVVFLFDEDGIPYDSMLFGQKDSNFVVEEFMLLANRTAAEVITKAYPSCALLRRHPEPNLRKLRGFEAFCSKLGLELDTSSSGQLHQSLARIKGEHKNGSVLFDILMPYAVKLMQLAAYFCSGDLKDMENSWGHYALAVPLYTHFTSPLRRYPDIVVHRTLAATVEAEEIYLKHKKSMQKLTEDGIGNNRCFTGVFFDEDAIASIEAQEALTKAASLYKVPSTEILSDVAAHCNERKQASRHVNDSTEKLYMWALIKKKKVVFSEARVLGLGPKFMSIYIHKLAIERRVCYDDVEGLMVEWLDATTTLVLSQPINKRLTRKGSPGKGRTLEEVALVINPCDSEFEVHESGQGVEGNSGSDTQADASISCHSDISNVEPAVFPLTVCLLSKIPVALRAIGGDGGPIDIGVRLYISSYYK